ncbi:SdpI family protein [Chloroflexota bacterium]
MSRNEVIVAVILVLFFAVSGYYYPQLPENIASHWNAAGQADGYMPKFWGLFFLPVLSLVIGTVLLILPRTAVLKTKIADFRKYYYGFLIIFLCFLLYIHVLTILWNIGIGTGINRFLAPAIGILFYIIGMMMSDVKMNRFFGIRTPWTLGSETVWKKTHSLGGKLFKLAGVVCFIGVFVPDYAIVLIIAPAFLVTVITVLYSWLEYRKETANREDPGI